MVVESDGPRTARLIVIGEALGETEERLGKPFVGPAGRLLNECLAAVGFDRRDVWVSNVVCRRPPKNKIEAVPRAELDDWVDQLHGRLADLDDPWMIVPLGNVALRTLTGREGILKHAGSVYEYEDRRGRVVKVMGNIHPAAVFRIPIWRKRVDVYWKKIAFEAQTRDVQLPAREKFIRPTFDDVRWYVNEALSKAEVLSSDIETPRKVDYIPTILKSGKAGKPKKTYGEPYVGCIGFSYDEHFGICIPTTEDYWGSKARVGQVWAEISRLLESAIEKLFQNGGFDTWYLANQGIRVRNYRWDPRWMHHTLDPVDDHNLAYLISVYLRDCYHKDDCKEPDEIQKYATNSETLWAYNCQDAMTQRALYELLRTELEQAGLLGVYLRHYRNLFAPLLNLSLRGILVDNDRRQAKDAELAEEIAKLRAELSATAGGDLYGKKNLSPKKLAVWLYDVLKLPRQRSRITGQATTSEVTIRRLAIRYPQIVGAAAEQILRIRRLQQLRVFLQDKRISKDGRLRSSYTMSPESGRLSATKAPDGTGASAQTIDREIRDMFIPTLGYVFVKVDASQGESRIVGALTRDPKLVAQARALPGSPEAVDEHRLIAARVFRKPVEEVTDDEREIGKRMNHGGNYGLHGKTLAESLLKDGYVMTNDECEAGLQAVLALKPAILEWHRRTRQEVLRDRALTNPFGRRISVKYERMDDELYRRMYAWRPQGILACITNQYGMVPFARWLEAERVDAYLVANVHDELLTEARPDVAYDCAVKLIELLERPVNYYGVELTVPIEVSVGTSWKCQYKWKRLPERAEFDQAVTNLVTREPVAEVG